MPRLKARTRIGGADFFRCNAVVEDPKPVVVDFVGRYNSTNRCMSSVRKSCFDFPFYESSFLGGVGLCGITMQTYKQPRKSVGNKHLAPRPSQ